MIWYLAGIVISMMIQNNRRTACEPQYDKKATADVILFILPNIV